MRKEPIAEKIVLTIAGFDPSGGAGLQADLRTFYALGAYGISVVTAVTVQNSKGISKIYPLRAEEVESQIEALTSDFKFDTVKIGMLASAQIAQVVADFLDDNHSLKVIVDPVMNSTTGQAMMDDVTEEIMIERILPRATLITPNVKEAEKLSESYIQDMSDLERSAALLHSKGAQNVLITGFRDPSQNMTDDDSPMILDFLFGVNYVKVFEHNYLRDLNTHGTGCFISSAIAALIANGAETRLAVEKGIEQTVSGLSGAVDMGSMNRKVPYIHLPVE